MIPIDLSIISLDELREQCQYKIIKFSSKVQRELSKTMIVKLYPSISIISIMVLQDDTLIPHIEYRFQYYRQQCLLNPFCHFPLLCIHLS